MGDYILLFPVFFPIVCGVLMPFIKNSKARNCFAAAVLLIELAVAFSIAFGPKREIEVWRISGMLSIAFANDGLSRIYICLIGAIWFAAAIFSFEYMKHETRVGRYIMFYTASDGELM